jgi:hypothetical protein
VTLGTNLHTPGSVNALAEIEMGLKYSKPGKVILHMYSETSPNRPPRKPALHEYRPISYLLNISLQSKSHKTGHSSKPPSFIDPSIGRFREAHRILICLFQSVIVLKCV